MAKRTHFYLDKMKVLLHIAPHKKYLKNRAPQAKYFENMTSKSKNWQSAAIFTSMK